MFTTGQRVNRDQVEHWIAEAFSYDHFKAQVEEREEPEHDRIRIITTITGPNGEPLVANGRRAVYFSLRQMAGMPQALDDWTA